MLEIIKLKTIMKIINKTPHQVTLFKANGKALVLPKSENPFRLEESKTERVGTINGAIPITKTTLGKVINLPKATIGVIYIVSRLVVKALPNRKDLYYPNETVRNNKGVVMGCKSISRN